MQDARIQDLIGSVAAEKEKQCSIDEAIQDAGYGLGQWRYNVLANGSWLADGSEALLMSAVADTLAKVWGLSAIMQGSLVALVYAGTFLGSLVSGWLGDSYGRRLPIILCYPFIIVFSILSGLTTAPWQLLVTRFLVGMGFGLGQPNAIAILVEATPAKWRTVNQGFAQVAFALGELYCCLMIAFDGSSAFERKALDWRWLLMAGAIPAFVFLVFSWFYLQESPAYVAQTDPAAAKLMVDDIRRMNGKPPSPLGITVAGGPQASTLSRQLRVLASPEFAWMTIVLCFVCFSYNLTVYGAFFAFPHLLTNMDIGSSALVALAAGAAIEIPFDLVGVFFSLMLSRKKVLGLSLTAIAALLLIFAFVDGDRSGRPLIGLCYYGLKGLPQIASLVLWVYISEVYPVAARATGTAVNLAVGRIGAIVSPIIYKQMEAASGGHTTFFVLVGVLTGASALAICTLSEPCSGGLDSHADEEEKPLMAKEHNIS